MKIAVAAEADPSEPRVAATPDTVKKMIGLGAEVAVQPGAGVKSGILDADYAAAGRDGARPTRSAAPTSCSRCAGRPRPSLPRSARARWSSPSWTPTATTPR